jgi:hypothetical protein
MLGRRIAVYLAAILFCGCAQADASAHSPGARALGMAGNFVAHADDSSAVWYNPAGLRLAHPLVLDATIELGQAPYIGADSGSRAAATELRYVAMYSNRAPGLDPDRWGAGAAYFSPMRYSTRIDAIADPIANTSYGRIDVVYRQLSAQMARTAGARGAVGGTVDAVWADVSCTSYAPCVERGPLGAGASLGFSAALYDLAAGTLYFGAVWRSAVNLNYLSTPDTGLGSIVAGYIPGRPETMGIGLRYRHGFSGGELNINTAIEQTRWRYAAARYSHTLADARRAGLGAEYLTQIAEHAVSLRGGIAATVPASSAAASDETLFAAGLGTVFEKHHFLDVAWESRDSVRSITMSYSYQR